MFDEFQEFLDTGRDMAAFFEHSRSYGVRLTVVTQNPNHPHLRAILDSVLINTRTHVVFGGVRGQVRHFTDEMAPTFTKQQLDALPAYHMSITTLVDNRPARPFEAAVAPIPRWRRSCAPTVAARSSSRGRRSKSWWPRATAGCQLTGSARPRSRSTRSRRSLRVARHADQCPGAPGRLGSRPARRRMTTRSMLRLRHRSEFAPWLETWLERCFEWPAHSKRTPERCPRVPPNLIGPPQRLAYATKW